MTLYATWIEFNSIEEKWDANGYKRFSKFACDYGIGKKTFKKMKRKKIDNTLKIRTNET